MCYYYYYCWAIKTGTAIYRRATPRPKRCGAALYIRIIIIIVIFVVYLSVPRLKKNDRRRRPGFSTLPSPLIKYTTYVCINRTAILDIVSLHLVIIVIFIIILTVVAAFHFHATLSALHLNLNFFKFFTKMVLVVTWWHHFFPLFPKFVTNRF